MKCYIADLCVSFRWPLAAQAYLYEKGKPGQRITIENSINKLSNQLTTTETPLINIVNAPMSTVKNYINQKYDEQWRI